jgi:hypothetical protein
MDHREKFAYKALFLINHYMNYEDLDSIVRHYLPYEEWKQAIDLSKEAVKLFEYDTPLCSCEDTE